MATLVSEVKNAKDIDFLAPCSFYAKITISRANLDFLHLMGVGINIKDNEGWTTRRIPASQEYANRQ
ncbi:hypothetical protein N7499_006032 [Penicillium canescens]|nr:hypothetical protein N7499_006032 [Penicillium canescens]